MPSFYRALCNLFRANPAASRKSSHARPASFEVLEKRNLLAGDLPAALTGSVVVDRTDDGLSNDDTALAGAVVQLYRDGGDGVFDGGQGDDVPLGSQTTDTEGQYRFDGLTPATYFVQQLPASGLLQRESATVQQVVISAADLGGEIRTPIDTFETLQKLMVEPIGQPIASSSIVAPEAIGGDRDLFVEITSGVGDMSLNAGRAPESLTFSASAGADGVRVVT
ncbi:MAG: SpaA isopeptide-forming pilin-related protein, partial [Planctomycetota bacterium]|nr:SpaA isopeptide-forming pilin-related protein [Planctomycetota bacterium]